MGEPTWNSVGETDKGSFAKTGQGKEGPFQGPSKVALIGGGKACGDFLTLEKKNELRQLNMEIVGVADPIRDRRR